MNFRNSKNEDLYILLNQIADLLEMQNASSFRIKAYRSAAKEITKAPDDLKQLARKFDLKKIEAIPAIGHSIANIIADYATAGFSRYLNRLKGEVSFESLMERNLIQIVDETLIEKINQLLIRDPAHGPTNGLPEKGKVTFTELGRLLWRELRFATADRGIKHSGFINAMGATRNGAEMVVYSLYLCQAIRYAKGNELRIGSINRVGSWRTWWWEKYPSGIMIECVDPTENAR